MNRISNHIKNLSTFSSGIIAQHYASKILDRSSELEKSKLQDIRDYKLNHILDTVKSLEYNCKNINDNRERLNSLSKDKINILETSLEKADKNSETILELINKPNIDDVSKEKLINNVNDMQSMTEEIKKILSSNNDNNFLPNINDFYKYLDSLSLLQESALLHITLFTSLIITVLNILAVLFSNEILKYFNLESKFPSLSAFLKLRNKFQKYYLGWNIFILFTLCIGGVGINLLVLYTGV